MKEFDNFNLVDIGYRLKNELFFILRAKKLVNNTEDFASKLKGAHNKGRHVSNISSSFVKSKDNVSEKKMNVLRKTITKEYIEDICDVFGVNKDWLLEGINPIFIESNNNTQEYKTLCNAELLQEGSDIVWIETIKIPEKAGMSLIENFFSDIYYNNLEKGIFKAHKEFKGEYFEIEVAGDSMNNGTLHSLQNKDWFLAKNIKREYWVNKINSEKWNVFYILHNEKGHLIKEITQHDISTGELTLHSWNSNKDKYPDFNIYLKDCYIVAKITKLINLNNE